MTSSADQPATERAMPGSPQPVLPLRRPGGTMAVREFLRRAVMRQHPDALKAAGRIVLAAPLVVMLILVPVLKAESWQALLGLLGLLIASLASSQLNRGNVESKYIGFGIAALNAVALGAVGLALGAHLMWMIGLAALAPAAWLVFAETRARTIRRAWIAFAAPILLIALACGIGRAALELSRAEADPARRALYLDAAWLVTGLRGSNGTERALLRLRQAQAQFELGAYEAAFALAHDGAFDEAGASRVPSMPIGRELLESLLRLKAQAFYNSRWQSDQRIWMPINNDPVPDELLEFNGLRVRWGW